MKIGNDVDRFHSIIKGKVRKDLKKFATSDAMTAQVSGKIIKVPLASIDLPRFSFGGQNGGAGSGDGEIGDPMPGQGKGKGKGGKEAGDDEGEHSYIEFDRDELADMIREELQLPDLLPKGKGGVNSEKAKYNKVGDNGVIRNFKRTYKNALQRSIASGIYSPDTSIVIPIRKDVRYKTSSVQPKPETSCFIAYTLDCSGSMSDEARQRFQKICFWIDLILGKTYKNIESIFIIHDTKAKVVERDDFFKINSSGGTQISSAFKLVAKLLEEEFPFSEYNSYVFAGGDGDNFSDEDNRLCGQLLRDRILPNCNAFNFGETKTNAGSGDFARYLEKDFGDNDQINVATIGSDDDILPCIKSFFKKGQ
jgi:uncharacterized sporulation protein YeaH/YhbH (DUF444 family)